MPMRFCVHLQVFCYGRKNTVNVWQIKTICLFARLYTYICLSFILDTWGKKKKKQHFFLDYSIGDFEQVSNGILYSQVTTYAICSSLLIRCIFSFRSSEWFELSSENFQVFHIKSTEVKNCIFNVSLRFDAWKSYLVKYMTGDLHQIIYMCY